MDRERDLLILAEELGVQVMEDTQSILRPGDLGGWFPQHRLILIARGLGYGDYLHVLAHELGHAVHNHAGCHDRRQERQADRFAAEFLVDPQAYAEAERLFGAHLGAIAHELGLARKTVVVWRELVAHRI